ncbi:hypothetical protein [Bacillus rhizoplanae]|uniref:hypothetical protein n=1 Tax=Bacillus rhizoplanae TaxID=2880966 RepID=UPI003D259C22
MPGWQVPFLRVRKDIGASTGYKVKLPSVTLFSLMESFHQSGVYGQFSSQLFSILYCPLMRDKDLSTIFEARGAGPLELERIEK